MKSIYFDGSLLEKHNKNVDDIQLDEEKVEYEIDDSEYEEILKLSKNLVEKIENN